jgi:glycerate 2-kinase
MADDRPELDPARRRRDAEDIIRAAIAAADPGLLVTRALHGAPEIRHADRIRIVAIGKAALAMSQAAADALAPRVTSALVVTGLAARSTRVPPGVRLLHGSHPLPDASSVAAGTAVLQELESCVPGDSVLVLLSGGASSLATLPLPGLAIEEYAACIDQLMRAGADIVELNTVRKHLDRLKGGRMALHANGTPLLSLVLSDVIGDPVDVIASGPLSPDPTTPADACQVLERFGIGMATAPAVWQVLQRDEDSPAAGDPAFDSVRVRVTGGNDVALNGAASRATELGYTVVRAPLPVTGPARDAGASLAREALQLQRVERGAVCIVAGGETTVAVTGSGRGGRNQELVLAACIELRSAPGITVASAGTDGIDGGTSAAGAVADENTLSSAALAGTEAADALADNDSHGFFAHAGGLIVTGATGTNVNDVHVALIAAASGA